MSESILFLFSVGAEGEQTVIARAVVPERVTQQGLAEWAATVLPPGCMKFQADALDEESVLAYGTSEDYEAWKSMQVGSTAIPNLPGTYTNLRFETPCMTSTTVESTTTTTTQSLPTTQPPTATTTTAELVPLASSRTLAATGGNSATLVVIAVLLILAGVAAIKARISS